MSIVPEFKDRDPVSASALNALAKLALMAATGRNIRGGPGINVQTVAGNVGVSSVGRDDLDLRHGIVTEITVGSEGEGFPVDVGYTVSVPGIDDEIGPDDWDDVLLRPAYGTQCKIVAQAVGSDVIVWMRRGDDGLAAKPVLLVLSEEVKRRVCGA